MSPLERRYRILLLAYPAWYRKERGSEMLATLLEASPPGATWPSLKDAAALLIGAGKVRARLNEGSTLGASLRLSVLLGLVLALERVIADQLFPVFAFWAHIASPDPGVRHILGYTVLAVAAIGALWFSPRWLSPVFALSAAVPWVYWFDTYSYRAGTIQPALLLAAMAVLALGRERLPRSWLWLAGAMFAIQLLRVLRPLSPLLQAMTIQGWFTPGPATVTGWLIAIAVLAWAVVDARPAIAYAIYLLGTHVLTAVLSPFTSARSPGLLLPLLVAATIAVLATWRLRRQLAL